MRNWRIWVGLSLLMLAGACSPQSQAPDDPAPKSSSGSESGSEFTALADRFFDEYLKFNPADAADHGFHEYDGMLPDVSQAAIEAQIAWQSSTITKLEGLSEAGLTPTQKLERQVMLTVFRGMRFDSAIVKNWQRNPMGYLNPLWLTGYISRDYAPLDQRAQGVIKLAKATPNYLKNAQTNLAGDIPKSWLQTVLRQTKGLIDFAKKDVVLAFASLTAERKAELASALELYAAALAGYDTFLQAKMKTATDDYALGAKNFLRMLKDKEALDISLKRLKQVAEADMQRNLEAIKAAAKKIDPDKSLKEVLALVRLDRPATDKVLDEARFQGGKTRQFLIDKEVVTIPSEDVAKIVESPPFARWNFAFISMPGSFEKKALPAYYYITPPDPSWPRQKQIDYVPARSDLLFTTIHELWPGHFLHSLHKKKLTSKVLKGFWSYAMGEGWAHYSEEMMWEAGYGNGDPRIHIGQLLNALMRNARFLSAIGLHAEGMTLEQSKQLFIDKGLQDEGTAEQQAYRGTFDPGYLNYTVGKLMIRKLRQDWKAKMGAKYSLRAFHDAFLSHGSAPVPVIRAAMLGENSGSPL